jgi:hypothetical protein
VLKPYEKSEKKGMSTREYRAADKGESWKFKLMYNIEQAMIRSRTRAELIKNMNARGYDVRWEDSRQSITYTCPNKMKCRDIKIHDEKFLKENMNYEFTIRTIQNNDRKIYGEERRRCEDHERKLYADNGAGAGETLGYDGISPPADRQIPAGAAGGDWQVGDAGRTFDYAGGTEGRGDFRNVENSIRNDRREPELENREQEYPAEHLGAIITGWEESRAILERFEGGGQRFAQSDYTGVEAGNYGNQQLPDEQSDENKALDHGDISRGVSVAVGVGVGLAASLSNAKPPEDSITKHHSKSSKAEKQKKQAHGIKESDDEDQSEGFTLSM